MGRSTFRFLLSGIAIAFIVPVLVLLIPVQRYFSFAPLFNGRLTGAIGETVGGLATPLLVAVGILLFYVAFREQAKAEKLRRETLDRDKNKVSAEAALKYILDLFSLFKQENEKISVQDVETAMKSVADSHNNYHNGQIPTLIFTSHIRYMLNTSAAGLHLTYLAKLLTQLIRVVAHKKELLPPEDYQLLVAFLESINASIAPKIKSLLQLNSTCATCGTNSYEFFNGKAHLVDLNEALESLEIKPYKLG